MPGDLITKICGKSVDGRVLRPIKYSIEYENGNVYNYFRERACEPYRWCLRDEQPIGIGPYGYEPIWTYWLGSLQSGYDELVEDWNSQTITFEEYAEEQGYPLSNTLERVNKLATVIQRFLRGRYFRNNLHPSPVKNYTWSTGWNSSLKCYTTEETQIRPGDCYVVATDGNRWRQYFRKVRVINKVWKRCHGWFITVRYDNGEIQTMRKFPFTHILNLARDTLERSRNYAIDTKIALEKNEIYELVVNDHTDSDEPRRELVKIVDILDFRGKAIVIQFFDGTFKVYHESKFRRLLQKSFTALQARPELRYVSSANEYLVGTNVLITGKLENHVAAFNHVWTGTVTKVLPDKKREVVFHDGDTVVYKLHDLQFRVIKARNYMRMHPFICGTILHGIHPYQPGIEVEILFDKGSRSEKIYRGLITECKYEKKHGSKSVCHETKAAAHSSKIMTYCVVYEDGDTRWYSAEKLDKLREDTSHNRIRHTVYGRYGQLGST